MTRSASSEDMFTPPRHPGHCCDGSLEWFLYFTLSFNTDNSLLCFHGSSSALPIRFSCSLTAVDMIHRDAHAGNGPRSRFEGRSNIVQAQIQCGGQYKCPWMHPTVCCSVLMVRYYRFPALLGTSTAKKAFSRSPYCFRVQLLPLVRLWSNALI